MLTFCCLLAAYLAVGGVSFLCGWLLSDAHHLPADYVLWILAVSTVAWPLQLIAYHFKRCEGKW